MLEILARDLWLRRAGNRVRHAAHSQNHCEVFYRDALGVADTYRSYGQATVRYPVLEVTATVEPFENGHGFRLRVHRAGKPRTT